LVVGYILETNSFADTLSMEVDIWDPTIYTFKGSFTDKNSTSGKNPGLLPATISEPYSKDVPSGGNFLNVITSYNKIPSE